jgi:hypothetical protein
MTDQEKKDKYGQCGEKNGMFGKTHTEEVKKNISILHIGNQYALGTKRSDETKKKLSEIRKTKIKEKNSFYGKKHTEKAKKAISESKKGKSNNSAKKITIDNINYNSLTEASKNLNIDISTISWRIRSENPKFDNYKFTDEDNIKLPLSTKISINNMVYESILEASKKLKFTNGYITRRLNSIDEEDSEWKILDIKRDKRKQIGRKVMINDIIYNSVKEASEKLNIIESTLTKRLNSKEPIPITPKKSVSIDNVIYESVTYASKKLNKNINVLIKYLKSDKFANCIYLPIEYIDLSKYEYL